MTDAEEPEEHGPKGSKKVVCNRVRIQTERHEVDPKIAFLVQCLLDEGLELCDTDIRDKCVELAFFDSETVARFYDLAVKVDASNPMYARAMGDAKPDDDNWWTYAMIVPPDPSERVEEFGVVLTLVFPYSDYDEVLRNVKQHTAQDDE